MKENVTQYNSGSEEQSNILLLDFCLLMVLIDSNIEYCRPYPLISWIAHKAVKLLSNIGPF